MSILYEAIFGNGLHTEIFTERIWSDNRMTELEKINKSTSRYKRMGKMLRIFLVLVLSMLLASCLGMPETVTPVKNFDLNRYLGKWYEIARLDHSFERGLEKITAEYSLREDGGVKVLNSGYSVENKKWEVAEGKAYFVGNNTEGYLKVSFFGPFYGSYVIFGLDQENYQYAFISGPDTSYLWLLSRTSDLPQPVIDKFTQMAKDRGFDTDKLIFVDHEADT